MKKKIKRRFSEKIYSLIGKISIEKYSIILQKDKIIKGVKKKLKIKDLFYPDQPKEEVKSIEDFNKFNNFKLSVSDNKELGNYAAKHKVDYHFKDMKTNPKFFYHNKHLELIDKLKRLVFEADNFIYAPKYDYIKPRLLTGPNWEFLGERKKEKKIYDDRDYYIKHEDVLHNSNNIKCLVDMNKTTQRIEFVKHKDIKFKNEKKFISRFTKKKNKNKFKLPLTSRNNESRDKIHKIHMFCSRTFTSPNNIKPKKDKKLNVKNHSIDFKKIISREDAEKVKEVKYFKIPFITPNYSLVEDRLISYKTTNENKSLKNETKQQIEGYDYKLSYSPDKYITKINNHIEPRTPNFTYMFHRNGDWDKNSKKNPLPFYMRDIYDRNSCQIMTEKSLTQNKFREGKISAATSSFLPKKSFNRIININLINSKNFKEKTDNDYIEDKKEFLKEKIKLRNKKNEIKELKNLRVLNKFENFTLKTLDKRENRTNNNSMKNIFSIVY